MGAYYCAICKLTTFSGGKKHIFGKSHQSILRVVLLKFTEKVKEARRTLKKPQVEKFDCTRHKQKFWCYCCGAEVERNVTDDNMTVMYGGLIEHMATRQHKNNTHKFWWDNKADPKIRDKVLITEEEAERFKAEVAKVLESFVEKEDEHIKQQADFIRAQKKHRQEIFQSLLERNEELEVSNGPSSTNSPAEVSVSSQFQSERSDRPVGSVFVDSLVGVSQTAVGQGLTFIGYQDSSACGNVHTGAVPPWLQDDPLEGSSQAAPQSEIGPSLQEFLKQKEQEKLRKLPPNRVGANFDHSSHTDANWLPSFGRVWNSGRRWQSRHQFRQEEGQKKRQKRKREHGTEASKKTKMTEQPTNSDM
ncbi:coiled-coil domain-containing protein 84 [Kryptolebias marmoratus]|uniref:coiled-coil domain-containing protein 84 n=1 Tax=Kryptolebias marmoratus TaxID=37003 RepID=UPI0007F90DEF|nr:coiled-coil domain-containing protein 84 [Kryptolebias marmoratus]